MSALALVADSCPVCGNDHGSLDAYWSCPEHGHRLKFSHRDGDLEVFRCPAHRCKHQRTAPPKPRSPSQGDPMTTVQTRPTIAVDTMWANSRRLNAMLAPLGIEVNLFIATAASALYSNADLMACAENNPASLIIALTDCASLGHLPDGRQYYLTPRGLKGAKSGPQVLGIEGYEGVIDRYYRSAEVAKVVVREVCAKDYFRYAEGEDDHPIHRFASSAETTGAGFFGPEGHVDRGPMVGVYCAVQSVDGHWYRPAILSRDDVCAARAVGGWTPGDTHSPWNRFDAGKDQPGFQGRSMWWKTAAKRAEPWVPTSSADKRQRARAIAQASPGAFSAPAAAPALPQAETRENGQQALPQARQDPESLKAAIRAHFERLGLEDDEERTVYAYRLARAQDGDALDGNDLAAILSKLESCDDIGHLHDIAGTP